jgi:hypothetical protein
MHPLFRNIPDSTIWCEEPYPTRLIWAALLDIADGDDGTVLATLPDLAASVGITADEATAAIARLLAPDPYNNYSVSDTGAHIEAVPGGWRVFPSAYISLEDEQ